VRTETRRRAVCGTSIVRRLTRLPKFNSHRAPCTCSAWSCVRDESIEQVNYPGRAGGAQRCFDSLGHLFMRFLSKYITSSDESDRPLVGCGWELFWERQREEMEIVSSSTPLYIFGPLCVLRPYRSIPYHMAIFRWSIWMNGHTRSRTHERACVLLPVFVLIVMVVEIPLFCGFNKLLKLVHLLQVTKWARCVFLVFKYAKMDGWIWDCNLILNNKLTSNLNSENSWQWKTKIDQTL